MEGTGHTTDMDIMVENTKVNTVLRMKNKQQNCKKVCKFLVSLLLILGEVKL